MIRTCLLAVLASTLGCASQPLCAPWSPSTTTATTDLPSPSTQASASTPTPTDDGTVFVAGPSTDEAWTSVVGDAPPPATDAPAKTTLRADRAASASTKTPSHEKKVAVAATPKPAKPAPAQAKPASSKATLSATPPEAPANDALRGEARAIYTGRCVPCHGASGRGDGPAGNALNPHPRNFTDKAWQASVTTAHIEKIVANGGPSVGKSPLMPAQADLASNPKLLRALAQYIKDFGR